MTHYIPSLAGGMLLGLSASLLLVLNGRIAGISGIVGRLIGGRSISTNALFVVGLIAAPLFYRVLYGELPTVTVVTAWPTIIISGLLVGIGTRMGSGCTSGHGIMGLARWSKRSIAATSVFVAMGIIVATLTEFVR